MVRGTEIGKADSSPYVLITCPKCHKERWVRLTNTKRSCFTGKCNQCWNMIKMNLMQSDRLAKNPERRRRWRGGYFGIQLTSDSPFFSMVGSDNIVREHRLVMAKHIGRPLKLWEQVHHINGNKTDNRIENLQLFNSPSEHNAITLLENNKIRMLMDEIRRLKQIKGIDSTRVLSNEVVGETVRMRKMSLSDR